LSPIGKARTGAVERRHQVPWPAVDRYFEDPGGEARSVHDRFVVAGQETRALTQLGYAQRAKIVLEEHLGLLFGQSTGGKGVTANVSEGEIHRARLALRQHGPQQRTAAGQESGKGCGVIIHCPAVEFVPVDGFERRPGQLQRFRLERRFFDQFKRARSKLGPGPLSALNRLG